MLNPSLMCGAYAGIMELSPKLLGLQSKADLVQRNTQPALDNKEESEAWKMAKKFEAAFIAQMLVHSGFAKALTSSGGEDVGGFTQFYMESLAKDISENGGFGIADDIYNNMSKKEDSHGDLGKM